MINSRSVWFLCIAPTLISLSGVVAPARAENWPQWRGPRGDGSAEAAPLRWNGETGQGVAWKAPIPGVGHASPIVWGDRVLLVTCLEDDQQRALICLDRDSGKKVWQREVVRSPLETKHRLNSFASSTPSTDGNHIYVSFLEVDGTTVPAPNVGKPRPVTPGRMVVACYDMDGNRRWVARPGRFVSAHGYCSNPVLFEDLVIVNGDHDGDSYVLALRQSDGQVAWKTPRKHETRSYVTPLIREIGGRQQLVFSGSKRIVSLNPFDGKLHWWIEGPTEQFVASMVYDGAKFYMAAGFPTYHVMAIRPDGSGNVSDTHVAWHSTKARCYVPSPVVVGKHLLVADDRGTANCFDTESGERLWQERLGRHFSASLVAAGGLVYFLADDGVTKIVQPGPALKIVAENPLGEYAFASPAVSDGQMWIRGEKHLYCIGPKRKR